MRNGDGEDGGALTFGEVERGGACATEGDAEAGTLAEADAEEATFDAGADASAVVFAEFDVFNIGSDEGAGAEGLLHREAVR